MSHGVNYKKLSREAHESTQDQINNKNSKQSYDFQCFVKKAKNSQDKLAFQIVGLQKDYQKLRDSKIYNSLGSNTLKPFDQLKQNQEDDACIRTTSGGKDSEEIRMINRSDPTGNKKAHYQFVKIDHQTNIREVQVKPRVKKSPIPQTISGIGSSQSRHQVLQTILSEEKFADNLLQKGQAIIDSGKKQNFVVEHQVSVEQRPLSKSVPSFRRKIEELSDTSNIQEESLQDKCKRVFGINFNLIQIFFADLFQVQTNNSQNNS